MSSREKQNKAVGAIMNGGLIALAVTSWASTQFSEHALSIAVGSVAIAIASSLAALRLSRLQPVDLSDATATTTQTDQQSIASLQSVDLHHILDSGILSKSAHDDFYWQTLKKISSDRYHHLYTKTVHSAGDFAVTMNIVNVLIGDSKYGQAENLENDKIDFFLFDEVPETEPVAPRS